MRGEYTKGAVRWYPPLHYRAAVCWRTEAGEDGYAVFVETAVGTFDRVVGSDRARVLRVWERVVLLGLEEDWSKEHEGALECA